MPRGWGFSKIWRFIFPRFLSPGIRVFENLGIFIPEIGYFLKFWDINARGSGIFIPEIGDFLKFWDIIARGLGILFLGIGDFDPLDWGFLSRGLGIFIPGIGDIWGWGFFRGMGNPIKSHL